MQTIPHSSADTASRRRRNLRQPHLGGTDSSSKCRGSVLDHLVQCVVGNLNARKGAGASASAEMGRIREILGREEAELV